MVDGTIDIIFAGNPAMFFSRTTMCTNGVVMVREVAEEDACTANRITKPVRRKL